MTVAQIHPGIVRITLPLPGGKPGPVNVYLFRGKEQTTLLDTGTFLSARFLKAALGRLGLGFKDLRQIVLTHGHIDHCGAVRTIVRQNTKGVTVCAHHEEIAAIQAGADAPWRAYERFLAHTGTPLSYRLIIVATIAWFQTLSRGCGVDVALQDGDHVPLGDHTATIVATPGHTRGSISLFLEKEGLLFSGDHILNHITPNALPMLENGASLPIRESQTEYFNSLEIVARLAPKIVHPAHGAQIRDFRATHDLYQRCFARRQQAILSIVGNQPPASIYAIARKLFPQLGGRSFLLDLFLAVSEVYSHLQVLSAEGRVRMEMKQEVLHAGKQLGGGARH